jgi:hypothetical protein
LGVESVTSFADVAVALEAEQLVEHVVRQEDLLARWGSNGEADVLVAFELQFIGLADVDVLN